jgi:hypothetical protein
VLCNEGLIVRAVIPDPQGRGEEGVFYDVLGDVDDGGEWQLADERKSEVSEVMWRRKP